MKNPNTNKIDKDMKRKERKKQVHNKILCVRINEHKLMQL